MTCCISLDSCREVAGSMTRGAARPADVAIADGLDDVRLDQRPAVHQRGIGRRQLDRRDRDALAERAVGEVDLAPRS